MTKGDRLATYALVTIVLSAVIAWVISLFLKN